MLGVSAGVLRRIAETAWLTVKATFGALPERATISKAGLDCLGRQQNMPFCTGFDGSDGTRTRDLRRDRPAF
jgi:hypothetical protein